MMKSFENVGAAGKEAMDNGLKSATAMVKGLQAVAAEATDYSKSTLESGSAALEKLLAAKSLDKAIEVQTDWAKGAWEAHVAQVTRLGDLYADLAKDAMKPFEALGFKAH